MKFIIDNILLFVLVVASGIALILPALQRRGTKVSLLQATQWINQGKTLILDVRNSTEFKSGHLPDAKNIPLNELQNRLGELNKFKDKNVVIVCPGGVQSSKATTRLKKAGFNNVHSLDGGLAAWQAQGLPTIK